MQITSQTKMNIVLSGTLFFVMLLVVIFGWRYVYQRGEDLIAQAELVAKSAERERQYAELSRLIGTTQGDREELAGYILTQDQAPNFVTIGEQLAAAHNVLYVTESLEEVKGEGDFDKLIVSFTMEGSNANVQYLLETLEVLPYHSEMTQLRFDKRSLAKDRQVRARVELTVTLQSL